MLRSNPLKILSSSVYNFRPICKTENHLKERGCKSIDEWGAHQCFVYEIIVPLLLKVQLQYYLPSAVAVGITTPLLPCYIAT